MASRPPPRERLVPGTPDGGMAHPPSGDRRGSRPSYLRPAGREDPGRPEAAGAGNRPWRPRRKGRPRLWWVAAAVLGVVGLGAVLGTRLERGAPAGGVMRNVAVIPYWNLSPGVESVLAHRSTVDVVSPWMLGVADDGTVVPLAPDQADQQSVALHRLRDAGLKIVPTIANYRDGQWRYEPIARVLRSPAAMDRHVRQIVTLATTQGWAGVDIDYEELRAEDRAVFTAFVQALAGALHARDLELSVDVFAKTTDSGYDQRNVAQDYAALGAAADQLRVMAYDYHWATSDPGPVAPVNWVRDVLDYALAHVPAGKILLGIPLYGYDWVGRSGHPVSWGEVYQLVTSLGATVRWDQASESPWLEYADGAGQRHTVWFENAYSSSAKIDLARSYQVRGVSLWMYGAEDQLTWSKIDPAVTVCTPGGGT